MTSDLHPLSPANPSLGTTPAPHDRAIIDRDGGARGPQEGEGPVTLAAEPPGVDPARSMPSATGHLQLRTRLFIIDLVTVVVCWVGLGFIHVHAAHNVERVAPGVAAAIATLVAMRSLGLYRARLCSRRVDEIWRIMLAGLWGSAVFVLVQYAVSSPGPQVLTCAGAYIVLLAPSRWQFGRWLRAQRARGRHLRGVLIVGSNEDAELLEIMLRSEPELGYRVTGVVGDCADDGCWNSLPTSPSIGSIPSLAAATGATGVLIVPYALSSAATQHAIAIAAGASLHVQVWPGWRGVGNQRLRQTPISDVPFFYVEPRPSTRWQPAVKRILDVSGAIVGLCLAAPFIFVAALLIKLEDRGPVLHRGERVGLHGQTFFVYKLRSMTPNNGLTPPNLATLNERVDGPLFKVSNDPRTTRVGRILRASSFDELPQLWNVLQGTMSLVGSRPALPSEVAQFDEELQRRHGVRPGMTGLWQVEARNNPSFNAYRRLDLRYVDNWSLWLDLTILVSTVPSVTSQAVAGLRRSLQH